MAMARTLSGRTTSTHPMDPIVIPIIRYILPWVNAAAGGWCSCSWRLPRARGELGGNAKHDDLSQKVTIHRAPTAYPNHDHTTPPHPSPPTPAPWLTHPPPPLRLVPCLARRPRRPRRGCGANVLLRRAELAVCNRYPRCKEARPKLLVR